MPGFSQVFDDKKAYINLKYKSIPKIKITENGLIIKAPKSFYITVELKMAFYPVLELTLGIKLDVNMDPLFQEK